MPEEDAPSFQIAYTKGAPDTPVHPKGIPVRPEGRANIYRDLIRFELGHGTKFYDAVTNEPLTRSKQIVRCLLAGNEVRYEAGAKAPLMMNFILEISEQSTE